MVDVSRLLGAPSRTQPAAVAKVYRVKMQGQASQGALPDNVAYPLQCDSNGAREPVQCGQLRWQGQPIEVGETGL